jgi:hypothetical protein
VAELRELVAQALLSYVGRRHYPVYRQGGITPGPGCNCGIAGETCPDAVELTGYAEQLQAAVGEERGEGQG